MTLLQAPSLWTKDSAALLSRFLLSAVGQEFMAQLVLHRSSFSLTQSVEAVALQAKEVEGYERAVRTILSLAEPPKEETPETEETYPPLDDDRAWGDKQKEAK